MYVSSIRQLLLTACLWFRKTFSNKGKNRIVHRLIEEWSTATPHSCIISIWTPPVCQGIFVGCKTGEAAVLYPAL
jgi:hypothetical protein